MSWVFLDDKFHADDKVVEVGNAGAGLFARALSYCGANLTDGFVTKGWAVEVGGRALSTKLAKVGLWIEVQEGQEFHYMFGDELYTVLIPRAGYFIPDYLTLNPSEAVVKARRDHLKEVRSAAGKKGAESRWGTRTDGKPDGKPDGKAIANGWLSDGPRPRPLPQEQKPSNSTPVDNSQSAFLEWADSIGLWDSQKLDALNLGPALLEEAMRATIRRCPDNQAAYFDTYVKGFLSAQRQWKSSMPLEQRLEIYVRNAGYIYEDDDLESELVEKGADDVMVKRLVRVAEEVRNAA
jgi:hypothetical protein